MDAEFDPNQYLVRILGRSSCEEASLKSITNSFDEELRGRGVTDGIIDAIGCMACPRSNNPTCIAKMDYKFHNNAKSVFRWALLSFLHLWAENKAGSSERCFGQARRLCEFHNQKSVPKACKSISGVLIPMLIQKDKLKEFLVEVGGNEMGIGTDRTKGWFDYVLPTAIPQLVIEQDVMTLSKIAKVFHKVEKETHRILAEPGYNAAAEISHLGPLLEEFMPEIGSEVLLEESRGDNPSTKRGLFDFIAKAFNSGNKKLTVAEVLCGHHQLLYNIVLELSGKEKEVAKRAIHRYAELATSIEVEELHLSYFKNKNGDDEMVKSILGSKFFSIIYQLEREKSGTRKLETLRQLFPMVGTVKTTPFVPKIVSILRNFLQTKTNEPKLHSLASQVFLELVQMLDTEVLGKHISAIVVCILQFVCPGDSQDFQPAEFAKREAMKVLHYLLIEKRRELRKHFDSIPFVFRGVCDLPIELSDVICKEMKQVQLQDRLRKLDELMSHESVGVRLFSLRQLSVILETSNPHTPINDASSPSSFTLFFNTTSHGQGEGPEPELALPLTLEATGALVRSWISGGEYVLPELSSIIQTLLKVSGSAQSTTEIQTLCARCLGIIGAMDPSRLNLETVGKHRKEMTMVELAFHLIESHLVPELGSDAGTQDRIAFAIQELLQFLMDDINGTHDGEIPSSSASSSSSSSTSSRAAATTTTRRTNANPLTQQKLQSTLEKLGLLEFVEPYFHSKYGFEAPVSNMDDSGEKKIEPLFTLKKWDQFSSWIGEWVTRLTSMCLAFKEFDGKRLLEALAVVTANTKHVHEKIALLLLPYLIKTALEHGHSQHFDIIREEILAVLGEKADIEFGQRRSSKSTRHR